MSTKKRKARDGWGDMAADLKTVSVALRNREMAENLYSALVRVETLGGLLSDLEIYDNAELSGKVDALANAIQGIARVAMKENEV